MWWPAPLHRARLPPCESISNGISVYLVNTNKIDTLVNWPRESHDSSPGMEFARCSLQGAGHRSVGTAPPPATTGITVSSPRNGGALASPIHVVATAFSPKSITAMRVYLDGVSVFATTTAAIDTLVQAATGVHNLTVQAWDAAGAVFKAPMTISLNPTTTLSTETGNNTSAADSFCHAKQRQRCRRQCEQGCHADVALSGLHSQNLCTLHAVVRQPQAHTASATSLTTRSKSKSKSPIWCPAA